MGKERSLVNKMDESTSLTKSDSVFRDGSAMCFTETWLHNNIPDSIVSLASWCGWTEVAVRAARRKEGEFYLCEQQMVQPWTHYSERTCVQPRLELLAVSLCPSYLSRGFSQAIVIVVYIPPLANTVQAADVINSVTTRLQSLPPEVPS